MKQDWTEQLRQRMAGYEEPVPDGLWEAIEQSLQQQDVPLASLESPDSPENLESPEIPATLVRRVPLRRWLAVAASVLVLITAGVALLFQRSAQQPESAMDVADATMLGTAEPPATTNASEEAGVATVKTEEPSVRGGLAMVTALPRTSSPEPQSLDASLGEDRALASDGKTTPDSTLEKNSVEAGLPLLAENSIEEKKVHETERTTETLSTTIPYEGSVVTDLTEVPRITVTERNLTVSLRGSNLLASNSTNAVSTSEPIYMARSYMNGVMYANNSADFDKDPIRLIDYADETEHQHPFHVGLLVSIPLTDKLWIESGLSYTRAKSTFTTRMKRNTSVYHQKLQYVGIPVDVGYTFWRTRSFLAYSVGGVQADVNVDARLETDGLRRHVDKDRLLLSVGGRAGVEYRFLPHFGLYVEPGLRCYLDNGSRLQTVFKEKPFQMDLQLGVRYSLK